MVNKTLIASMALAVTLGGTAAVAATGKQLMDGVQANQKIDEGLAPSYAEAVSWGYLTGIIRATSGIMQNTGGICPTQSLSKGQLLDITARWLNKHPDRLEDPDYVLVAVALAEAFPCPK
jgi:hypothetical protein